MAEYEDTQWSQFQAPTGYDITSWVSPVAQSYSDAAKMAVAPISRAFEQMVAQRFEERQAIRAQEDRMMLQREQDAAALARIDAEYDRRAQESEAKTAVDFEMRAAEGRAMRDMATPVESGASQPPPIPLRWDAGAFMPQRQAAGIPQYPPISDAAAATLGSEGVATVQTKRALETERATNNAQQARAEAAKAAEDAAKAVAAQRAEQGAGGWRLALATDEDVSDADVRRLTALSYKDFEGASREYSKLLEERRAVEIGKAERKAKKVEAEAHGGFMVSIPGLGDVELPTALRDLPLQAKKEGRTISVAEMDTNLRDSLWQVARAQVEDSAIRRGEVSQADVHGLLSPDSPLYGKYNAEVRLRANEIASRFFWEREPGYESGRPPELVGKPAQPGTSAAPAGQQAAPAAGSQLSARDFLHAQRVQGATKEDALKALAQYIDAPKMELLEAAKSKDPRVFLEALRAYESLIGPLDEATRSEVAVRRALSQQPALKGP